MLLLRTCFIVTFTVCGVSISIYIPMLMSWVPKDNLIVFSCTCMHARDVGDIENDEFDFGYFEEEVDCEGVGDRG